MANLQPPSGYLVLSSNKTQEVSIACSRKRTFYKPKRSNEPGVGKLSVHHHKDRVRLDFQIYSFDVYDAMSEDGFSMVEGSKPKDTYDVLALTGYQWGSGGSIYDEDTDYTETVDKAFTKTRENSLGEEVVGLDEVKIAQLATSAWRELRCSAWRRNEFRDKVLSVVAPNVFAEYPEPVMFSQSVLCNASILQSLKICKHQHNLNVTTLSDGRILAFANDSATPFPHTLQAEVSPKIVTKSENDAAPVDATIDATIDSRIKGDACEEASVEKEERKQEACNEKENGTKTSPSENRDNECSEQRNPELDTNYNIGRQGDTLSLIIGLFTGVLVARIFNL